tara:strand:- start:37190 stop:38587 length:1398 start_codon:yes stop_codon:yes gene_type:complete
MKKFLKITLSLLVILVIGYFIYTKYQKTVVFKNVVHIDAESVIKVSIHDIKKTLIFDALSSPKYYWNNAQFSEKKKENDTIEEPEKGIDLLPYALVFYTIKEVENTVFTTFKIDDATFFEAYALRYFKEKNIPVHKEQYNYVIDEKSKMIAAWNSERLSIAFSPNIAYQDCKSIFDDVLLENKLISDRDNFYMDKLRASDDHITYLKGNSEVTLNFRDGKAVLKGMLYSELPRTFKSETSYTTIPNASLQLYIDANFKNDVHKKVVAHVLEGASFFKKNNIEVSTFLSKVNGSFSLAIKGTTTQKDTIITYEYDDNFEKVEIKQIQEKKVPAIMMNISSENKLNDYLTSQGAIQQGVLTAIPYYTFYAKQDALNATFTTVEQDIATQKMTGSYFFSLKTDFRLLQQDISIPKVNKVTTLLESLEINARQGDENKIELRGNLQGMNADINILSQLFFSLQAKDSIL